MEKKNDKKLIKVVIESYVIRNEEGGRDIPHRHPRGRRTTD